MSALFQMGLEVPFKFIGRLDIDDADAFVIDFDHLISFAVETAWRRYGYLFDKFIDKLRR